MSCRCTEAAPLVRWPLEDDLVDEINLVTFPVIIGHAHAPAWRRRESNPGSKSPQAWGIDIPFDPQLLPRYQATSLRRLEGQLDGRRAFVFECKSAMTKTPGWSWLLDGSDYTGSVFITTSSTRALLFPPCFRSKTALCSAPVRMTVPSAPRGTASTTSCSRTPKPERVALNHAPLFEPPDWFAGAFAPKFTEWLGTKRGVHFRLTPDWLLCVTPYGTHKGQGWTDVGLQIKTAAAFLRRIGPGGSAPTRAARTRRWRMASPIRATH